jgi:hypothetical protein
MTAYVNRIGGTKGGLIGSRARTATFKKLIDVDAEAVVQGIANFAATDTLAICRIPVGCYLSCPSIKLVKVASGTSSTVTLKGDTTALISTAAITGTLNVPVMEDTAGKKYACSTTGKDIILLFSTDVPTGAKILVSWTFEDTMIVDPSTQV